MRIDQITFTRFIAAISIVIFHYGREIFPFKYQPFYNIFTQSNLAVSYFFLLSGFIMVFVYYEKDTPIDALKYYKARFARVYPVYFLALVLFLGYVILSDNNLYLKEIVFNTTLTQTWIPGYALSLNSPGWSLSVEVFFYLIFPIALLFIKNIKRFAISVFILWIISQFLFLYLLNFHYQGFPSKSHDFIFYYPLLHLSTFLLGMTFGFFYKYNMIKLSKKVAIILFLLSTSFVLVLLAQNNKMPYYHNGLLSPLFVIVILALSYDKSIISRTFSKRIFVLLGDISYGIYILQTPIYYILYKVDYGINMTYFNDELKFYIYLVLLCFVSYISYLYIEKPIRNTIKNIPLKPILLNNIIFKRLYNKNK